MDGKISRIQFWFKRLVIEEHSKYILWMSSWGEEWIITRDTDYKRDFVDQFGLNLKLKDEQVCCKKAGVKHPSLEVPVLKWLDESWYKFGKIKKKQRPN